MFKNISLSRLLGTKAEHKEHIMVVLAMLIITGLYQWLALSLVDGMSLNWFEFVGTWAGLVCVWLARTENVLSWPWGIVGSICFGFLFSEIGLPGQQWLNWGYFLMIQIVSWPYWAFGGKDNTDLPITALTLKGRLATLVSLITLSLVIYFVIDWFAPGSVYPVIDAVVVASSITAQYLLGRKFVENWWLWLGPVNVLSIFLFYSAGAYVVTALYVAFLIHAAIALRDWQRSVISLK
jgi:nicotinamide mononucleotide transporter